MADVQPPQRELPHMAVKFRAATSVAVAAAICITFGNAGPANLLAQSEHHGTDAGYPYTAADVHFMSAMISHHAQAIVMSRWVPTHGASPSIRTLAERIINAQQDEIRRCLPELDASFGKPEGNRRADAAAANDVDALEHRGSHDSDDRACRGSGSRWPVVNG